VLVESADHQSRTLPAKRSWLLQQKEEQFLVRSSSVSFSSAKARSQTSRALETLSLYTVTDCHCALHYCMNTTASELL
jgi:hypothetical protein